jgi:mono/diheme cytochrome c family protein
VSRSRWPRFLIGFPLILAGVVAITLALFVLVYPKVDPAAQREVEGGAAQLERGRHLVEDVATCTTCHSPRDWTKYGAPFDRELRGAGGVDFSRRVGLPGVFPAPNLTPDGVGEYTDGELARALQTGVSPRLGSLMPVMPYMSYAGLCARDVDAIIVYLRSLESRSRELPERELDFPLPLLIRTFPEEGEVPPCPPADAADAARGAYLVRAAGCANCHTSTRDGGPRQNMDFAGGSIFDLPNGSKTAAPNLTFDESTGIGTWTEEQFVQSFRTRGEARPLAEGEMGTNMPWVAYAGLSDDELGDIYRYLEALPPVPNLVKDPTRGSSGDDQR